MYISQQIAALVVTKVLKGRSLTLALPEVLRTFKKVTPQQRGGATDLSYGTLRHYAEANAYLQKLLQKPLTDRGVESLLLVAMYQLLYDQADDFTVVNQAVKAVSMAKPKWAKGLVNAVLRNFLRQRTALEAVVGQSAQEKYSYPRWWVEKLRQQYAKDWESILQVGNMHPPMTLRVNTRKSTVAEYTQLLTRQEVAATALSDEAVMLNKPLPVDKMLGFNDGVVSVQDYGAQLAAHLLDLKDGMRVLDACSAPGGKTGHILEQANVNLTAIDQDQQRLDRVGENLERLGFQSALVLADVAQWQSAKPFDRILADVPCTASGIVRRHVDIKWLRRKEDTVSFTQQQARILSNLWRLLAKGGKLLYVTCSVFAEENQQQIDRFLQQQTDATQLDIALANNRFDNINIKDGQLIPSACHDGFFYAILQKD